jgi:hypothetical protein
MSRIYRKEILMRSFSKTSPWLLAAGFLALSLFAVPGHAAPASPRVLPIAVARHLPLGTLVTIDGSVTTPSGAFASSFFDEGFAVQDATGGIFVSLQTDLGVAPRAQARVTGTLADSGGLLILVPAEVSDVKIHGKGPKVEPIFVPTGFIGELTEGRIVQVVGTIDQPVVDDLPFGYKVFVNDGSGEIRVFVNLGTGIDVSGLAEGQRVSVTGFSGQFEDYEIDPRFPSDIRIQQHH